MNAEVWPALHARPSDDADIIDESQDAVRDSGGDTDDRGSWLDALFDFLKDEKEDRDGTPEA